ncbi:MAG: hypothetical protein R3F61_26150 [Myxococcota bacterium]
MLLGSTWIWVGAGDVAAVAGAAITAVGGVVAAVRRRALDRLPLELASRAAVSEGPAGSTITVRAWLGRGRPASRVSVVATMGGDALPVIAHPGPVVGRFQAVITGLPEGWDARDLVVSVTVRSEGRDWSVERTYAPAARSSGRFAAGITTRGGLGWDHASWDRIA